MSSPKLRKRLLAGILCAGMIFQSVPMNVSAYEDIKTVEESEIVETERTEDAGEEAAETSVVTETAQAQTKASDMISDEPEAPPATVVETKGADENAVETEVSADKVVEETENEDLTTEAEPTGSEVEENPLENQETVSSSVDDDDNDIIDYTKLVMSTERTYYYYGEDLYIVLKLTGCEIADSVIKEFAVDDKVCGDVSAPFGEIIEDKANAGYYIIRFKKGDLSNTASNSHNIRLTLSRETAGGEIRKLVERTAIFNIVQQDIFLEKTPYYMGVSDENVEVTIFNTADDIERVALSNNGETVAAPTEESKPVKDTMKTDPRYTGICSDYEFPEDILPNGTGVLLHKSSWTLTNLKNAIDLGSYNLNLVFNTGETMDISGAVSITSEAVVTNCNIAVDYDNTSKYAYLFIQGSGFDPARVTYNFKRDSATGSPLSSSWVSYKEVWSGYIVKFQKIGNWPTAGETIYVSLRGNNINFSKSEFTSEVQTGIYYAAYNPVIKAVEAGVAEDLNGKKIQFSIVQSETDPNPNLATTNSLTESLIYLTPKNPLKSGKQYVKLVVDGKEYFKEFNVDAKVLNTSSWDAPKVISKNAERHYFYYYYQEAGIISDDLSAEITAEDGEKRDAVVSAAEWLREDAGRGTSIKVVIPTQKLKIGKYTVEIFKNADDGARTSIASYEFEIIDEKNNKFILDEYSISWVDDDTMQVYIKTPNCSVDDSFDIKLTETSGREVEDLKAVVTNRYSDSIYMEVTGLKRTKAFRDYYVLLTHSNKDYADQGYPFKMSDMAESYYKEADKEKGELKTIAFNRGMPIKVTANNRVVGIDLQYMTLPATVNLYAPNGTDVLVDLNIMAATEEDYYYFTKEFYDRLPNKDALYDMVIYDADGWGRTYPGVTIGYREEIIQNDFKAEITTNILFLGVEGEDTAEITVTGNKQKPTFEARDEDIVTVTADAEDPNKAVVRAAEKTGTTVVTIFADGVEKSIIVTVTAKVDGIVLDASSRKMWVGDTVDVKVYTLPIGSEDDTHIMTFTSSDPSVLYVKQLTATTARITAMGSGTAMLRVSLNGTTHVTSMSVSVTGIFSLTEKKAKIAEAGISAYIENVDRSLEYCALPEGWEWDDDSISPSASDDAPVQYYGATYRQEGYETFSARLPVAVTRITGINIEGKNLINRGKEETYNVTYEYVGRNITWEEIDKRLSVNCIKITDGDFAQVASVNKEQIIIATKEETEGGTAEFRFTLSIDNGTIEGSDMLVKTFSVTVPLEDCVDNIVLTPVRTADQGFTFIPESKLMELNVNEVKNGNGKYPVSIALEATINGVPAKNIAFSWQSSDENIASFTKDKNGALVTDQNGNVVLTVKSVGVVQITAVAGDPGAFVGSLTINVMDYEPVLDTATITVNKHSTTGTMFALQEQNGNLITRVRVLEQDAESPNFAVKLPVNGMSTMTIKDNSPAKNYSNKTTTKATLEVETSKGGRYQYPVTIVTEVAVPKASLKLKQKANLFYADAAAVYTISSNYEIASVVDVGSTAYPERFYGILYDKNNKTVTFSTKGTLNSTTVGLFTASKSPSLETRLRINFTGYSEPQYIDVKVQTENKKPSFSITGLTVCPDMSSGTVNVVNTKTKENFILKKSTMELTMPQPVNSLTVPEINSDGSMSLSYYGNKGVSYTVAIKNSKWTQPVNAKGKITYVKSPELLKLALGKKQVTLNMGTKNANVQGEISIPVSISGNSFPIEELFYDGTAKPLIDSKVLSYKYDSKKRAIVLELVKNSKSSVKAGNYKLNLYATIMVGDNPVTIKKETLTIKIADEKAAKVTMASPKGKINLIERNTTSVVYTPKVSGIESAVKSVSVTGDTQRFFTASLTQENKVEVKARTGIAGMSSKTTYNVTILSTLENGYQIETVVKIKPLNKLPKIVLSPNKGTLYKTNSNKFVTSLSLQNSSLDLNSIAGITLDAKGANAERFSLSNDLIRNGTISFALAGDKLNMKAGTYKLTCQVRFKDADADAKPATIRMTVTVK